MTATLDKYIHKAAAVIGKRSKGIKPVLAVTLGSGLGAIADLMEGPSVTIPYTALPGFPQATVAGHEGSLKIGTLHGTPVVFMKGRKHLYEGPQEAAAAIKIIIRTLKTIGVEILFLTNAAGSLRAEYGPGSVVAISDHINMTGTNPLCGPNDDQWGPRFVPMENAWDADLRTLLLAEGKKAGVSPLGAGVYCQFMGPTFETLAEVRTAKILGADTVGMSTAVENIIARHCGIKCVGVSAITNLAAGMSDEPLSHEQTLQGAKMAEDNMIRLIGSFIRAYGQSRA